MSTEVYINEAVQDPARAMSNHHFSSPSVPREPYGEFCPLPTPKSTASLIPAPAYSLSHHKPFPAVTSMPPRSSCQALLSSEAGKCMRGWYSNRSNEKRGREDRVVSLQDILGQDYNSPSGCTKTYRIVNKLFSCFNSLNNNEIVENIHCSNFRH